MVVYLNLRQFRENFNEYKKFKFVNEDKKSSSNVLMSLYKSKVCYPIVLNITNMILALLRIEYYNAADREQQSKILEYYQKNNWVYKDKDDEFVYEIPWYYINIHKKR